MPKILNDSEMKEIADNSIAELFHKIKQSSDPQYVINVAIIEIASKLAVMNLISMGTTSDEEIVPVFNYHFENITTSLLKDQKSRMN